MKFYILVLSLLCLNSLAQQQTNEDADRSAVDIVRETVIREHGGSQGRRRAAVVIDRFRTPTPEPAPEIDSSPEESIVSEITPEPDSDPNPTQEFESIQVAEPEVLEKPVREKKADILFIVDNSRSMDHPLREIDQKMESFLESLGDDLDWQIGVIDSDLGNQGLFNLEHENQILAQRFLTKDTPFAESILIDTLTRNDENPCDFPPYCGTYRERPLRALKQFVESNEMIDFSREGSLFVAIIITDNKETPENNQIIHPSEILNSEPINNIEEMIVYSIAVVYEQCARQIRSEQPIFFKEGRVNEQALELSNQTRGTVLDICSDSYSDLARSIEDLF